MEPRHTRCEHLIDAIYDAGASPEHWPATLSRIASEAGAVGAIMFGFSKRDGLVFEHNGSLDGARSDIFKARHLNNAWVRGMSERAANCLVLSGEIQRLRELKRSAFYDEVLRPQQIAHAALCTLKIGADLDIQFSVQRAARQGEYSAQDCLTLRRLVPHLRRAMGVSLRLAERRADAAGGEALVQRLRCAAFTLDGSGELLELNPAAAQLAAGGAWLPYPEAWRCTDPAAHVRWREAVRRVLAGEPLQSLVVTQGEQRIELVLASLRPGDSGPAVPRAAHRAAVLVMAHPLAALSRGDGLTPAEWRIAQHVASGRGNSQIAHALGLSPNTVKTHMRRIYQKLQVHRQSELMLLLTRNGPPPG